MSTSNNGSAAPAALRTRNWFKLLGYSITSLVTLVLVMYQIAVYEPKKSGSAAMVLSMPVRALPNDAPNMPQAWRADGSPTDMTKWPRVHVPPHSNSVHVPSIAGGHIVWGGSGFKVRYVYSDGHECALGDISSSCGDGNIVEGYALNEGDTPLYASYAYARQDEK